MRLPPRQEHSSGTMPLPTTPGTQGVNNPEAWMGGRKFVALGAISVFLMIGPFLIWRFWASVNNWGWWRPGAPRNSHHHRHYIRTWHGWVTVEKYEEGVAKRKRARTRLHKKLAWKTSTADYGWIFWDPNGERQRVFEGTKKPLAKWLPAWVRSREFGSSSWRKGDERLQNGAGDLEKGLHQMGATQYPPETRRAHHTEARGRTRNGSIPSRSGQLDGLQDQVASSTTGALMSGALTSECDMQNAGTIRRRIVSEVSPAWMMDGVEIELVATQQHGAPQILDQHIASTTTRAEKPSRIKWPRVTSSMQESGSASIQRAHSVPAISSRNLDKNPNRAPSLPSPNPTLPHGSRILYRARPTDGPCAPNTSEDLTTPRGFTPNAGDLAVRFGDSRTYPNDLEFASDLNHSLQVWAKPMLLDPFASTGCESCGTAGRRTSPAMGWATVGDELDDHLEDMRGYEDDGESGLSGSDASSSFNGLLAFPRYGKQGHDEPPAYDGEGGLRMNWSRKSSLTNSKRAINGYGEQLGIFDTDMGPRWYEKYRQVPFARTEAQAARHSSRSRPDRAIHASPIRSPKTPIPKRSVSFILPTSKNFFPLSLDVRRSLEGPVLLGRLSLPETCFLHTLDCKLTWLNFQLSPGFRGPEDNPAESWHSHLISRSRFSGNVVSRATETQKRLLTRSGARRTEDPIPGVPRVRERLQTPNIDGWRTAVNALRWLSGTEDILRGVLQFEGDAVEAREEDIDTAAWVLRRPPQGFAPPDVGVNAYYTGVKGYAEKMWEWEVVRRPYILERLVRRHEGKENDGVAGAVVRSVGKILGFVRENGEVGNGEGEEEEEGVDVRGDGVVDLEEEGSHAGIRSASCRGAVQLSHGAIGDEDAVEERFDAEAYERQSLNDHALGGSEL